MARFVKTLNDIWLCIKYPFLYPRNRWTGKHWESYILRKYLYGDSKIFVANGHESTIKEKGVFDKAFKFETIESTKDDVALISQKKIVVSPLWAAWFYVVYFIAYYVLPIFHCIPEYTELDGMEPGWRTAFGKQMCDDLKAALKKAGCLYSWRILDIKEKWGGLRLYSNFSPKEVDDVINKYEALSYKTCIICGKPATRMSQGWISPYCDKCGPDFEKYEPITNES